jgi:hypothetical protein
MSVEMSFDPNGAGPGSGRLTITGDNTGNGIKIANDGNGVIMVESPDLGVRLFFDVREVDLFSGAGPDTVSYYQTGDQVRDLAFLASLEAGKNVFSADLLGHAVKGHLGIRAMTFEGTTDSTFNAKGVKIAAGAALGMYSAPSVGTTSMEYSGVKQGFLEMVGKGDGRYQLDATFLPGSRRSFEYLALQGGPDADYLEMQVHDFARLNLTGVIDGGGGNDTAVHTPNVRVVNCAQDIVVGLVQRVRSPGGNLLDKIPRA